MTIGILHRMKIRRLNRERDIHMIIGDAELKVMKILWEHGKQKPMEAKQVGIIAAEKYGWNKNTTYTLLKRCVDKGTIKREDPNFLCTALVTKEKVQKEEMNELIEKLFDAQNMALLSLLLQKEGLTQDKVEVLIPLIEKLKEK